MSKTRVVITGLGATTPVGGDVASTWEGLLAGRRLQAHRRNPKGNELMASTEEIRSSLAEIVNEIAGIPVEDVQLDKSFTDDLDVDSLSMVEVVVAAEEKFSVKIPDDEVKNLKTVGDAVAFIERAQNG
jgi:acyl carrier protein